MRALAILLHRLAAWVLLPRAMRHRFGEDQSRTFARALDEARADGRTARFVAHELLDLVRASTQARGNRRRRRARRSRSPEAKTTRGRGAAMRRLWDDGVHALRSIRRAPGHSLFIVGTLALALGATTLLYGAVQRTVVSPLPYEHADRMVSIVRTIGQFGTFGPEAEHVDRWTADRDVFERSLVFGLTRAAAIRPSEGCPVPYCWPQSSSP